MREPSGLKIDWKKGIGATIERRGPDKDSIDASVLTLRFFIQDNEPCSFRNMAKIYEDLPISLDKKKSFEKSRDFVNFLLDQDSPIGPDKGKLKNRDIFYIIIYGGLAHANKEKKKAYDQWISDSVLEPFITNEFVWIVAGILKAIFDVENLNEEVLKELGNTANAQR